MNVDLFVTAGPNRGAYVPIAEGRHSVGTGGDADIVLEGVGSEGVLVFEVGTERIKVVPVAGANVRVDGRTLGRGGLVLQAGSVIEFGDSELRAFWDATGGGGNAGRPSSMGGWPVRIIGVLVIGVGVALFLADMWSRDLRQSSSVIENPRPTGSAATPVAQSGGPAGGATGVKAPEPISGTMLEGVEARVKSVLRGTGLSGKIDGGRLVVVGSVLTSKDEKRLEAMIAEVRPYVDVDVSGVRGLGGGNGVAPPAAQVAAPAKIVAINIATTGPSKSYFETQDGARYFEGAVFGDGYLVSEIRSTVVAMEKGGRKLEYPLTGR